MKKKNIILIIIVILLVLIFGGILIYNNQFVNNKELVVTESLITKQAKYEEELITKGYTIDNPNVVLDPYHNSPLTALVMFETEEEVTPTITVHGEDELSTFSHTFESSKIHYLPVYGLYPDTENTVTITYTEDGEEKEKELKIKTEALPEDFILPTSVEADKENLSNDLYFFTPSSKGYTCAYDVNGDVRWYLSSNALWDNARLENGHLLISTERLINSPYYMTGLYEIDLLGKIYQEYSLPGGYHHDYDELPNGNLLVASDDFNNPSGTVEDYIVELDRTTGNIVKTFDLKDVLPMEEGKSENWINYDWFHNNSVWYDEATNSITLSGRHQDAVINIDYESGELNWIIGDSTNWSEEYQKYFFTPVGDDFEWQWSQHAAMITPEGYVFILDNGNNKSKVKEEYVSAEDSYTRGVMYKIDTDEMTIEQVWEYGKERGSEFYSPYISDVDYIEKDHYIVHSGGIVYKDGKVQNQPAGLGGADELVSDTVELLNDEVIFEIKLPTNNYRVEKMNVYEVGEYQKGQAKRLGSLGKTEVTKTGFGLSSSTSDLKEIKEEHEIEFTKEEDRLVFTGRFKRGVDVNIVLYQDLFTKVYNVSISKKPYTALCVDIFSEEETENGITVTKYINAEGLSGKYSIYLEVDGKLYNSGEYVTF
ncbi:MAG TPA: aryl-sulfate sulfotransferase [Candidatus Pelethosoma merdigallinarum]|nr:aryl-sulfate sulfotransferase [Candidatus Pelethosoma merdigallinarum]